MSSDIRIGSIVKVSEGPFKSIYNGRTGVVTRIIDNARVCRVAFDNTQFSVFSINKLINVLDIEEDWFPGEMLQLIKEETKMSENRSGRYPWAVEGLYVFRGPAQLGSQDFTVGKEYTFVNGKTLDDKGCVRPLGMDGIPVPVTMHDDPKNDDWTVSWFKMNKFEKAEPLDKDLLKKLLKMTVGCDGSIRCGDCREKYGIGAKDNCSSIKKRWASSILEVLDPESVKKPEPLEKWKDKLPSEAYDILKEIVESDHDRRITVCFKQPYLKTWRVGILKGFNPENGELNVDIRGDKSLRTVQVEHISDLQRWKGGLCGQVVPLRTVQPLIQGQVYSIRNGKITIPVNSGSPEVKLFPGIGYIRSEEDQYFKDNFVLVSGEQEADIFEHANKSPELANGLAVYMLHDMPGEVTYGGTYKFINGFFIDDGGNIRPLVGGGLYTNAKGMWNSVDEYGFSMVKMDTPNDRNLLNGRAIQVTPASNRTVGRIYRIKNGEIVNDDMKVEKLGKMLHDMLKDRHGLLMLDESDD